MTPAEQRRIDRVRILLETRNDYLPGPPGSRIRKPGVPQDGSSRVPCECRTGRVKTSSGSRLCLVCDGRRWRRKQGDEPLWDEYLERRLGDDVRPERSMEGFEIDNELERLRSDARIRESRIDPKEKYGWERGRERRDRSGSYRELELVLEKMAQEWPEGRTLVARVYESGMLDSNTGLLQRFALFWIERNMPKVIRIPRWAWLEEQQKLEPEVKAAAKKMGSLRDVAEHFGLTTREIRKLVEH